MNGVTEKIERTIQHLNLHDLSRPPRPEELFIFSEKTRAQLLQDSITFARDHIPFYQSIANTDRLETIEDFPIADKDTLLKYGETLMNKDLAPSGQYTCTSGTTRRERVLMSYCKEELHTSSRYDQLTRLILQKSQQLTGEKEHTIKLQSASRRILNSSITEQNPFSIYLMDLHFPRHLLGYDFYDHIIRVLFQKAPTSEGLRQFNALISFPPFLIRSLTEEMLLRKVPPTETAIRKIVLGAGVISDYLANYLRNAWNADVKTYYGCTEIGSTGLAWGCPQQNGRYHFPLTQYVEVVDPKTGEPVQFDEAGAILLSPLYPFRQMFYFLRYRVGDIVKKVGPPCPCGYRGQTIDFIGRESHCIPLPSLNGEPQRNYLGTTDFVNIFDCCPEIPPYLFHTYTLQKKPVGSHGQKIEVHLEVTCKYSSQFETNLQKRLHDYLFERRPDVRALCEANALSIEFILYNRNDLQNPFFLGT